MLITSIFYPLHKTYSANLNPFYSGAIEDDKMKFKGWHLSLSGRRNAGCDNFVPHSTDF